VQQSTWLYINHSFKTTQNKKGMEVGMLNAYIKSSLHISPKPIFSPLGAFDWRPFF
jgi:hypothetical protein